MLHPRIDEVATDATTGETYVLVRFWKSKAARARDDPPFLTEDFVMQLRPTGERLIDEDNPALGKETFDRDLEAEIQQNIWNYAERAERLGYEGDNTSGDAVTAGAFSIGGKVIREAGKLIPGHRKRDESDPHGVLAKPEVKELRDKDIDLAVQP